MPAGILGGEEYLQLFGMEKKEGACGRDDRHGTGGRVIHYSPLSYALAERGDP